VSDAEDLERWALAIPDGFYEIRRGSDVRIVELRTDQDKLDVAIELRDFLKCSRDDATLTGSFTRVED
jgi:hypothetical protein